MLSSINVVFEDNDLIVIDKPAGMLVLLDRYDLSLPNLYGILKKKYGQLFVVHRIDKETSGLIIFAKSEESHQSLNSQFEHRETEKEYQALCKGEPEVEEGQIELSLAEDKGKKERMKVNRVAGKEAITNYSVLERFDGYSLIQVRPRTGRTHQIRVHLKAIGLPILGDSLYATGEGFYLSQIKPAYRTNGVEKPLLDRTALHASRLSITHPRTGQRISFEAEMPKDMRITLNYLRKFRNKPLTL